MVTEELLKNTVLFLPHVPRNRHEDEMVERVSEAVLASGAWNRSRWHSKAAPPQGTAGHTPITDECLAPGKSKLRAVAGARHHAIKDSAFITLPGRRSSLRNIGGDLPSEMSFAQAVKPISENLGSENPLARTAAAATVSSPASIPNSPNASLANWAFQKSRESGGLETASFSTTAYARAARAALSKSDPEVEDTIEISLAEPEHEPEPLPQKQGGEKISWLLGGDDDEFGTSSSWSVQFEEPTNCTNVVPLLNAAGFATSRIKKRRGTQRKSIGMVSRTDLLLMGVRVPGESDIRPTDDPGTRFPNLLPLFNVLSANGLFTGPPPAPPSAPQDPAQTGPTGGAEEDWGDIGPSGGQQGGQSGRGMERGEGGSSDSLPPAVQPLPLASQPLAQPSPVLSPQPPPGPPPEHRRSAPSPPRTSTQLPGSTGSEGRRRIAEEGMGGASDIQTHSVQLREKSSVSRLELSCRSELESDEWLERQRIEVMAGEMGKLLTSAKYVTLPPIGRFSTQPQTAFTPKAQDELSTLEYCESVIRRAVERGEREGSELLYSFMNKVKQPTAQESTRASRGPPAQGPILDESAYLEQGRVYEQMLEDWRVNGPSVEKSHVPSPPREPRESMGYRRMTDDTVPFRPSDTSATLRAGIIPGTRNLKVKKDLFLLREETERDDILAEELFVRDFYNQLMDSMWSKDPVLEPMLKERQERLRRESLMGGDLGAAIRRRVIGESTRRRRSVSTPSQGVPYSEPLANGTPSVPVSTSPTIATVTKPAPPHVELATPPNPRKSGGGWFQKRVFRRAAT